MKHPFYTFFFCGFKIVICFLFGSSEYFHFSFLVALLFNISASFEISSALEFANQSLVSLSGKLLNN